MSTSDAGAALAPPDVASAPTTDLPAAWHRTLVSKAKSIANREARRLNFAEPAGVADVTRRLNGYAWKLYGPAAPDYDTLWQIAEHVIELFSQEGRQSTFDDFSEWQRDKSILGVRAKAALRKDRNEGILEARAADRPVKEVAEQYSVGTATVTRVATPLAVAAWRQHQQVSEPISPPLPDDSKSEPNLFESPLTELEKGSDTIVDCWERNVGTFPTRRQQMQLITWYEAGQDNLSLPDLVRLIVYARGKRDPWAYVTAGMARLGGEPEWWKDLSRRASNKQRQYAQYALNPRAYLATCIRNESAPAHSGAVGQRNDWGDSYRKRHDGRNPWEVNPL